MILISFILFTVNYFKNLIPSMNKDRFVNMIKFYEIIIKEMFNLNKTKILQYLVDFMIKRKNAQLDLLNYNYETNSSPNFKQKVSSTFEMPDSTQFIKSERKITKLHDTSYNFVIRSDPIYLSAGSTFMTNHRDVIKCRATPCVQNLNFERRPFDNNILKGRRIGRRIMNDINDETKKIQNIIEVNNQLSSSSVEIKPQIKNISGLPALALSTVSSLEEHLLKPKFENESFPMTKSSKTNSSSPILVDTPSSSPPIHKIIKPQIISQQILQRAFSERIPDAILKEQNKILEKFPISNYKQSISIQNNILPNHQPLEQQSTKSNESSNGCEPMINGQLSLNEIKTLNQNGTEIIPTPILRHTITSRRKTIDADHAPVIKASVEVKKVKSFSNEFMKSPSVPVPTTKSSLNFLCEQSQLNKQASKILKRRQSCHERIFAPKPTNASNIERHFMNFINGEYESKKREAEMKRMPNLEINDGKALQFHNKQQEIQKPIPTLYTSQPKRVRFMSEEILEMPQQSPQTERTQLTPNSQKVRQSENHSPRALFRESLQNSLMQPPLKPYQSPIDYQQYQLYFERELRERGFVDRVENLQDRDVSINQRPLELVSHVPPERYLQQSEPAQQNAFTSPKLTRPLDKSPRVHQRTPIMTNDEKATIVAYNQLQSLHRDPSNLTAQQYSEHLKQLHQFKQIQKNSSQGFYQDHQNQLLEARDKSYKNLQQSLNQQSDSTISPRYYPSQIHDDSNDKEQQSLQRKLKLKAKSTKYVEPSQLSKMYQSTPRSTYYTDPYTMTAHKKPPTPTGYNHLPDRQIIEQNTQEQLSAFYNMRTESSINPQLQYQWMLAQHHHQQQQHQQQHQNLINQPARPIPRQAIPSQFNDAKLNGIPANHNMFSHNPLQTFSNQQSDFYRRYFPKNF